MPPKKKKDKKEVLYDIEELLDRKITADGERQYLTKWVGYKTPTWEPKDNFLCQEMVEEFERNFELSGLSTERPSISAKPSTSRRVVVPSSDEDEPMDHHTPKNRIGQERSQEPSSSRVMENDIPEMPRSDDTEDEVEQLEIELKRIIRPSEKLGFLGFAVELVDGSTHNFMKREDLVKSHPHQVIKYYEGVEFIPHTKINSIIMISSGEANSISKDLTVVKNTYQTVKPSELPSLKLVRIIKVVKDMAKRELHGYLCKFEGYDEFCFVTRKEMNAAYLQSLIEWYGSRLRIKTENGVVPYTALEVHRVLDARRHPNNAAIYK